MGQTRRFVLAGGAALALAASSAARVAVVHLIRPQPRGGDCSSSRGADAHEISSRLGRCSCRAAGQPYRKEGRSP